MNAILTLQQAKEILFRSLAGEFEKAATSYNSPIQKIAYEILEENREQIKKEFNKALTESLNDKEFMIMIREEFKRKVAKVLVGKLEGEVTRVVDTLRQDQALRARMILAIQEIIDSKI